MNSNRMKSQSPTCLLPITIPLQQTDHSFLQPSPVTFRPQSLPNKTKHKTKQNRTKYRDKMIKDLKCTHLMNSGGQGLQSTLANSLWDAFHGRNSPELKDHSSRLENLA